ncbi:MAG: dihydroneopterin aldolase [Bacteroidia bacterium]
MTTISLEGIIIKAPIGFYKAERMLKRNFAVDIKVLIPLEASALEDDVANTINYEALHSIVQSEMEKPAKLIETVAAKIANEVQIKFPQVRQVWVKISKPDPMMNGTIRQSAIEYVWSSPEA